MKPFGNSCFVKDMYIVLNFKEMGGQGPISFYFPQLPFLHFPSRFLHFSGMKNTLVFIAIITQTCLFGQNSEAIYWLTNQAAKTVTIDLNDLKFCKIGIRFSWSLKSNPSLPLTMVSKKNCYINKDWRTKTRILS
jgi:hypothetical protein